MAIAIYTRVSTVSQLDGTSPNEQLQLCKKKAYSLGFYDSNIRIYQEGSSGEDIDTRIELTKLREDVADGIVTAVICTHPDRFSRDLTDKLIVCRELEKDSSKLYFTDAEFADTPEGNLFFNVMSCIAAYELALIRKRTVRGRIAKVRDSKKIMPMRVAPFGYDKDNEGQLIINETERVYVQMIYEWYVLEKLTLRQIGERLYGTVMPKRAESPNWSATSIRNILTSELYIGKYYYNRRATKKIRGEVTASGKPKKTYEFREKKDWLVVEIPPIIDSNMWEMAQKQRVQNTTNRHVGNRKYEYLLKSILKCGHCGRAYDATTYSSKMNLDTGIKDKSRSYRCPNKAPKKYGPEIHKCVVPSFNAEVLENYIWGQVLEIAMTPEKFITKINNKDESSLSVVKEKVDMLEKELRKKENALFKVDSLFFETESDTDVERYDNYRKRYINEIQSVKEEIESYRFKMESFKMEELSNEQITFMVNKLRNELIDGTEVSFETKRKLIEMLFDEIIITLEEDNSENPVDGINVNITSIGLFDKLYQEVDYSGVCSQPQKIRQYW